MPENELFTPGHTACAGCGAAIALRMVMKALGPDTIIVNATGCSEIFTSKYPQSAWRVPYIHCLFENAAPVAAGVAKALEVSGNDHTKVVVIAGDGATYDIGFGCLSGALERNDNILYICYDNEAYMNCLALSTLVMTEKGSRKITEITKGDKVYAFDQQKGTLVLKECSGVFENGCHDVFELTTPTRAIKATPNHPFLISQKSPGKKKKDTFVWKTLSELKKGEKVVVLNGSKNFESEKIITIRHVACEPTLDLRVEGEHNFIANGIVVHNTGVQRSGATPFGTNTTTSQVGSKIHGKTEWKKPILDIVAAHHIPYAASTTIAYFADLDRKVKKAAAMKGARFINIHAPCVPGWGYDSALSVKLSRLAVETGMWKMCEIENGKETISVPPKMTPVVEYFKLQKRFKHLTPEEIEVIQKKINAVWGKQ